MSDHFYSINRGKGGMKPSDVTYGTSSTSADDIELRVADGASLTRLDVKLALEAFEKVFETGRTKLIGGTDFPKL